MGGPKLPVLCWHHLLFFGGKMFNLYVSYPFVLNLWAWKYTLRYTGEVLSFTWKGGSWEEKEKEENTDRP